MTRILPWSVKTVCATLVFLGCQDAVGLDQVEPSVAESVVVTLPDTASGGAVLVIDPATGRVVRRPAVAGLALSLAVSDDHRTAYVGTLRSGFRYEISVVDLAAGVELARIPESLNGVPTEANGIGLLTSDVFGLSTSTNTLVTWRAIRDGVVGIAAVARDTYQPVAFSGPWNVADIGQGSISTSGSRARSALLLLASRTNASGGPLRTTSLFMLDPVTLMPFDSISPSVLGASGSEQLWQVVPAPDGASLYLAGSTHIVRYDLVTRRVLAQIARPATGALALSRDGQRVLITDVGTWPDSPGSGLLYVFDALLQALGTIDVSTPLGGVPRSPTATVTGLAASSADGRTMYVSAGSEMVGPLFPPQRARLLVVDLRDLSLKKEVTLPGYGRGRVALGPTF